MQKNPGLAAVLSFLFCGLGQIYNGQFGKAVAFILGAAISGLLCKVRFYYKVVKYHTFVKKSFSLRNHVIRNIYY